MQPSRPGREDSRRDLMNVAIDCFAKYGYAATSIDRIAKAAGVTKGALYYHFKDKEELLFEAVRNRVGQFERSVVNDLPAADARAALRKVAQLCFDHATRSNHRRMIVTLMVEALDTNPRLESQFREMMQRFRTYLSGLVQRGQEQLQFRADVDPRLAAEVFAGAVMGAEIQYYQDPKRFDLLRALEIYLEQFFGWLAAAAGNGAATKRRRAKRRG